MAQKDHEANPIHVGAFLENFALRTLVVKARINGWTRAAFLEACGAAWDATPDRLTETVRSWVNAWTSDDSSPGKSDGS